MKIVETYLEFREGLRQRSATRRTVLHHSDTEGDVSAMTIHMWHLAKTNPTWAGIGYHFVIRLDGTIERGRPIEMIGSHAGANGNPDSIGVCWAGRFILHGPTDAQIRAYVGLHKYLESIYGPLEVWRHCDVMATECPGGKFPIEQVRQLVKGGAAVPEQWKEELIKWMLDAGLITSYHDPDTSPTWAELAAVCKRLRGEA